MYENRNEFSRTWFNFTQLDKNWLNSTQFKFLNNSILLVDYNYIIQKLKIVDFCTFIFNAIVEHFFP